MNRKIIYGLIIVAVIAVAVIVLVPDVGTVIGKVLFNQTAKAPVRPGVTTVAAKGDILSNNFAAIATFIIGLFVGLVLGVRSANKRQNALKTQSDIAARNALKLEYLQGRLDQVKGKPDKYEVKRK